MLSAPPLKLSLHAALKARTLDRHRAVERTPTARALFRGTLRPQGLAGLLEAWREPWAILEAAGPDGWPTGWRPVPRTPAIDADQAWLLQQHGARPPLGAAALGASLARQIEGDLGTPRLFGALYVLEGSAMGAVALARCLERAGLGGARAFHQPHGLKPQVAFGRLLALGDASLSPTDIDDVLQAADATFDAVHALYAAPLLTEVP